MPALSRNGAVPVRAAARATCHHRRDQRSSQLLTHAIDVSPPCKARAKAEQQSRPSSLAKAQALASISGGAFAREHVLLHVDDRAAMVAQVAVGLWRSVMHDGTDRRRRRGRKHGERTHVPAAELASTRAHGKTRHSRGPARSGRRIPAPCIVPLATPCGSRPGPQARPCGAVLGADSCVVG